MVDGQRSGRRVARIIGTVALLVVALSSCTTQSQTGQQPAAPTVAPIFSRDLPTSVPIGTLAPRVVAEPTPIGATDAVVASRLGNNLERIPVFDNGLSPDWSLDHSTGLNYSLQSRSYVSSQPFGIEATPLHGAAKLFFTVRRDARQVYEHDRILGVSIMVNGGPDGVGEEDLLFTVMGSNAYTYWRENDTSVEPAGRITDEGTLFDEQRLYFLDFRNGIPPNTWGEVVIWLDDRILDAEYDYLTGIYILTDERFVSPFYIDEVNLLVPKS